MKEPVTATIKGIKNIKGFRDILDGLEIKKKATVLVHPKTLLAILKAIAKNSDDPENSMKDLKGYRVIVTYSIRKGELIAL